MLGDGSSQIITKILEKQIDNTKNFLQNGTQGTLTITTFGHCSKERKLFLEYFLGCCSELAQANFITYELLVAYKNSLGSK